MRILHLLALAGVSLAACNGHDELCGKKYSEVNDVGTHDSAFVGKTPTHNQYIGVADQLDSGVRFLQAQTHDKSGDIEMCHSFCWELDAGPLTDYLKTVADWIKDKPNEVVTLLLTNQDAISMDKFDAAFDSAGLKQYVFHPKDKLSKDQWPTLQELIDAGTRVVVFMDYHTDQSKVDYIINEFDYFWETPYGITDKSFPTCDVDRPSGGDPKQLMGIVNHMLNYKVGDIVFPNQVDAATTNSKDSIMKQVNLCVEKWHVTPNIVLVDWVNIGDAKQARLALNGLS